MKRTVSWLVFGLFLALSFGTAGCELVGPEEEERQPVDLRDLSAAEKEGVRSDNVFGFRLFQALHEAAPDENLFVSPLSVSVALGMTLNGASGATYDDMRAALGREGLTEKEINEAYRQLIDLLRGIDPKVVFEIANSIWYREGFAVEPTFLDVNTTYFDAEVAALDFSKPSSVDRINGWVDDHTHGKIKKVIEDIGADVVMYLINAIYFKGTWMYEFDRDETVDDTFHNADGSSSAVKMMQLHGDLPVYQGDGFAAVDLPYGDSLFSMTVLLPEVGHDVHELAASLDSERWRAIVTGFQPGETRLALPRFKLEYENSLVDALSALGMGMAFTDAADFSRIRASGGLKIDDVIHKTYVEVNEEGTEAAAVTVVIIVETSVGGVFRVDRPFVFAIRERHSGSLLFIGKVMEL